MTMQEQFIFLLPLLLLNKKRHCYKRNMQNILLFSYLLVLSLPYFSLILITYFAFNLAMAELFYLKIIRLTK